MPLPKFLKKYFWDVDFEKLDTQEHPYYVLQRILEFGNEKAVAWMRRRFNAKQVKYVLTHLRGLSPKSANFWAIIYGIDKERVICLQKHYLRMRRQVWPY